MRKLIALGLLGVIGYLCFILYGKVSPVFQTTNDIILIPNASICQYELQDGNTMQCDLETVSMICKNMIADGFNCEEIERTSDVITMQLSKEDVGNFLIKWNSDREFVCIGSPYEKSYLPLTYLSENK